MHDGAASYCTILHHPCYDVITIWTGLGCLELEYHSQFMEHPAASVSLTVNDYNLGEYTNILYALNTTRCNSIGPSIYLNALEDANRVVCQYCTLLKLT